MTGFTFDLALREAAGQPALDAVELDGIPLIGQKLRITRHGEERDLFITQITWFHAPGALSKSGLLTLSEHFP
jgi:hypothetical protein